VYFIFGFLWTNALLNAFTFTALAGSYAHWYFLRRDPKHATRFPLSESVYRTLRYHLGSLAFGAFLVALVQLARLFAIWLDKQTKALQVANPTLTLTLTLTLDR
jgi:choline transporter-like protein 2/4/5